MKPITEHNPILLGAVGLAATAGIGLAALNYDKLPLFNQNTEYSAYFTEASGLIARAPVEVSGYQVGRVDSVTLDGPRVLVTFNIDKNIALGDRTEAAVKTGTVLGSKYLEIFPRGAGTQHGPIPTERTRPAYQLPEALGDIANAISGLDTDQLSQSLRVLSQTFSGTAPQLQAATDSVGRLSDTLNKRDDQLRNLLANANAATGVLAQRSAQIVQLVQDSNALLAELQSESASLDQISGSLTAFAQQIKGFINDNRNTFKPALDKLNGALAIINAHRSDVQKSITGLRRYVQSLGEAVSSGPFFKAYVANLLPGQFVQPFIDAAFSDLGLDPSTLLPSQITDPPVGQPGTPALPVPYPRTGQGGEPRQNIPDAITGNPGDPRYPYRQPPAPHPPGGPPPGPPAVVLPPPPNDHPLRSDPLTPPGGGQ